MTGISSAGVIAPMPARIAEIRSRFVTPASTSATSSGASSSTGASSITTENFDSLLTSLLGSDASSDDPSISTSSLASVLAAAMARSSAAAATNRVATTTTTSSGPDGNDVVEAAKKYLGVPYVWGGTDPTKGLDCSGFVQRTYKDLGIELPRVSYDQAKAGTEVPSLAQAKPGDLIAFGSPVDHIAIYVGDGKIIQAPHRGTVVSITPIRREIATIRRIIPDSGTAATSATGTGATPTATLTSTGGSTGIPGAEPYEALFQAAGAKYGLNPRLLAAVAKTESNFNPNSRSGVGAIGLMQFMPATARGMGIDPTDPAQAIDGAARYLRGQLDRFGSAELALAAYNAGPGAVQRYGGIPPYTETRNYVTKVMRYLDGQSPTDGNRTTNGVLS